MNQPEKKSWIVVPSGKWSMCPVLGPFYSAEEARKRYQVCQQIDAQRNWYIFALHDMGDFSRDPYAPMWARLLKENWPKECLPKEVWEGRCGTSSGATTEVEAR